MFTKQWDKYAGIFDQLMGDSGDRLHQTLIDPLIHSYLADLRNGVILDAGCGNGYLLRQLATNARQVIGVESSEELIKLADKRLEGLDNVSIRFGDLEIQIPFHDQSSDVVIASMVVHYLESLDLFVTEAYRILKPGGRVIVIIDHPMHAYADAVRHEYGQDSGKFIDFGGYLDRGSRRKHSLGGQAEISFRYRPVMDYINAFANHFRLVRMDEVVEVGGTPRILGILWEKV